MLIRYGTMTKKTVVTVNVTEIDVLRAHAIAAALKNAKPKSDAPADAHIAWNDCCRYVASVVCSADGVNLFTFYNLCTCE